MFNKFYNSTTRHSFPSTIKEIRAPTDESIRLAEEYKQKTRKDLVCSYRFDNPNSFTGQVEVFKDDYADQEIVCIRFVLNGKEHYFEQPLKRIVRLNNDRESLLRILADRIGSEMVRIIMSGVIK